MANESIPSIDTVTEGLCPERILDLLQSRQKTEREHGLQIVQNLLKMSTEECHSDDPALVEHCSKALADIQELIVHILENVSPTEDEIGYHHDENGSADIDTSTNGESDWETKHGCLSASLTIILRTANSTSEASRQFLNSLQQLTLRLICDQDVRVRLLAG